MSRKPFAIAAALLAVTLISAAIYHQPAHSQTGTLVDRLNSLRQEILQPRESGAPPASRGGSYSERHRSIVEGQSQRSAVAESPAVPVEPQISRLPAPGSNAESAPARTPPVAVVDSPAVTVMPGTDRREVPIHGVPRRVRPAEQSAPGETIPHAAAVVPATEPSVSDPPDEALLQQRQQLRSSRRLVPEDRQAMTPAVVAPADEPRLDDEEPEENVVAAEPSDSAPDVVVDPAKPEGATARSAPATAPAVQDRNGLLMVQESPLLSVQTIGSSDAVIGKPAAYQVRVTNLGGVAAEGVALLVELPEWAEIVSMEPTRGATRSVGGDAGHAGIEWQVGAVEANTAETLILEIVPRRSQAFDLAVNWTFQPTRTGAVIEVKEPKLDLAIEGPRDVLFGETKVYRLIVSNPGTGTAENVEIRLLPIDGGEQPAASQPMGDLSAGESRTLEIELTAGQVGPVAIRASVVADHGLQADLKEQILVRRAELQLEVTGPEANFAGTPAGYRVVVSNPGNARAENVRLRVELPEAARHLSAGEDVRYDEKTRTLLWNVGALESGEERVFDLQCVLHNPGGNALRMAVSADGDLADSAQLRTVVETLAELKLDVVDPSGPIAAGEDAVYEVRITNRGTKRAENIEVVAFFSEGIEPVSVEGGAHRIGPGQVQFQPIASLDAGGETVLKIVARAEVGGNHIFRAEVRCEDLGSRLAAEGTTRYYDVQRRSPVMTATRPDRPADRETAPANPPQGGGSVGDRYAPQ